MKRGVLIFSMLFILEVLFLTQGITALMLELEADTGELFVNETIKFHLEINPDKPVGGNLVVYQEIEPNRFAISKTLYSKPSPGQCYTCMGDTPLSEDLSRDFYFTPKDEGNYYAEANFGGAQKKVNFTVTEKRETVSSTLTTPPSTTSLETTSTETIVTTTSIEPFEEMMDICSIGEEECGEGFTPTETSGENKENCICLTFFYSPTCEHCHRVDAFLNELKKKYPQLTVTKFNVVKRENAELKEAFDITFDVPEEKRAYVPAVYLGDKYFIGDSEANEGIDEEIKKYIDTGLACPCEKIEKAKPGVEAQIIERFKSFGVFAVVFAGLIDGVNPCAFGALVFFISYLAITGRKGKDILFIGFSFTAGIFITYLLTGLGMFKFLHSIEEVSEISKLIYPFSGLMALIFAIYSFFDYRKARAGKSGEMVLQLPESVKRVMHGTIRKHVRMKHFTVFAFFTGILISLFEFLCTGQVYLPTIIYIMGMPELRGEAFFYLVVYNIMFITPLIAIFLFAYFGTTSRELSGIIMKHTATIKILTALLFFILAGYMFLITLQMFGL